MFYIQLLNIYVYGGCIIIKEVMFESLMCVCVCSVQRIETDVKRWKVEMIDSRTFSLLMD